MSSREGEKSYENTKIIENTKQIFEKNNFKPVDENHILRENIDEYSTKTHENSANVELLNFYQISKFLQTSEI